MTKEDIDFIKSMCFQGPDMTERQQRRVQRIIDDMRMLESQLSALQWVEVTPESGAGMIAAERARQVSVEGWTPEHDDKHDGAQLVLAAVTYALETSFNGPRSAGEWFKKYWCFEDSWFKLSPDPIRNLTKAGALIAAEIDRLKRLPPPPATGSKP